MLRFSSVRMFAAAMPLIAYRAIAGGMPIALGLFIAYRWGVGELASFTVANAVIAIALVVTDWGATRAFPRNLATLPASAAAEMLAGANLFRLLLLALLLAIGVTVTVAGVIDASVARYLAILFPVCLFQSMTTNAVSERVVAYETRGVGAGVMAGLVVFAVLGVATLALQRGPLWLVAAYVIGKGAETVVVSAGRWWVLSIGAGGMGATAAALWPFGMQMILGVVYTRLAVFTVERATTRAELGVFSLAVALQSALLLVPSSLALLLFPEMTQRAKEGDRAALRRVLVRYALASVVTVALGVVCLGLVMSHAGRRAGVPDELVPFVVAFIALAFLTIFSMIAGFLMQASGRESLAARLSVLTLSLALVYQIAALRAWGLWGIIAAVAAAEVTTIIFFGVALQRPREA